MLLLLTVVGFLEKLAGIAFLTVSIAAISWVVRTMMRRNGGQLVANPLQPGWGKLHDQYESVHNVPRMKDVDGRIGVLQGFQIGFDTTDVVIRNPVGFSSLVRIPYLDITILQTPEKFQVTRFSEPEYSPGRFQAAGVEIILPAYWAQQLQQRIEAASA